MKKKNNRKPSSVTCGEIVGRLRRSREREWTGAIVKGIMTEKMSNPDKICNPTDLKSSVNPK